MKVLAVVWGFWVFMQCMCILSEAKKSSISSRSTVPSSRTSKIPLKQSSSRKSTKASGVTNKAQKLQDDAYGGKRDRIKENFIRRTKKSHDEPFQSAQSVNHASNYVSGGTSMGSYFEIIASQGKDAVKSVIRSAKVLKSSAFEALLLKATWPDDNPVPRVALHQIIHESIPAFEKYMALYEESSGEALNPKLSQNGYSGCEDPYYMTNHKLYMKMVETDWRTTLKALYIFHNIFRESSQVACESFRQAMNVMRRKRALKYQSSHSKYFDEVMIEYTDAANEELDEFISHVTKFVMHRSKYFSGNYEELISSLSELLDPRIDASAKDFRKILFTLKTAQRNLDLALRCKLGESFGDKIVAAQSYHLVAKDVLDIWVYLSQLISSLADTTGADGSTLQDLAGNETAAVRKTLLTLVQYYERMSKKIPLFFFSDRHSMRMYRSRIKMENVIPTPAALHQFRSSMLENITSPVGAEEGGHEYNNYDYFENAEDEEYEDDIDFESGYDDSMEEVGGDDFNFDEYDEYYNEDIDDEDDYGEL